MNCIRIQGMITRFINDELNIKELEVFLDHVFTCPNCMEEVEIYYTLLTAMKQLDEDKNLSGDFKDELRRKLEEAQDRVIHAKYTYYRKKAILILIIAVIAFALNFSYTSDLVDIDNYVIESNFHIRKPYISEGYYRLDKQLQEYLIKTGADNIPDENIKEEDDADSHTVGRTNESITDSQIDGQANESEDGNYPNEQSDNREVVSHMIGQFEDGTVKFSEGGEEDLPDGQSDPSATEE